ncbi:MAG: hypothetical protein ACXVNF_04690 [Neobacillus sp.]
MYRFSIKGEEWILRFTPQLLLVNDEKQEILLSLINIANELSAFSHGDALLMFTQKGEAIVIDVERIPSFILTVSNIIPEENWYNQNATLKPLKKI